MEPGTVSMRVAFVLRSAEVLPAFLWFVQVDVKTTSLSIQSPQSTTPMIWLAHKRKFNTPLTSTEDQPAWSSAASVTPNGDSARRWGVYVIKITQLYFTNKHNNQPDKESGITEEEGGV